MSLGPPRPSPPTFCLRHDMWPLCVLQLLGHSFPQTLRVKQQQPVLPEHLLQEACWDMLSSYQNNITAGCWCGWAVGTLESGTWTVEPSGKQAGEQRTVCGLRAQLHPLLGKHGCSGESGFRVKRRNRGTSLLSEVETAMELRGVCPRQTAE